MTTDSCYNFDNFFTETRNNHLRKYQISNKSEHPVIHCEFFKPKEQRKMKARQIIPTALIQIFLDGFR